MGSTFIEVRAFLRNLPLFRELAKAELDRIAAASTQVRASAGTLIVRRGDPSGGFHVIVYGQVRRALGVADGSEKVLEVLGPGQSFGEAGMFLDRPHIASAEALTDAMLISVGKRAVVGELESSPETAKRMLAGLAARLHRVVGDLEAVALESGMQRVIGYLLGDLPENAGPSMDVELPTSKRVIASHLNLTRERFSHILDELAASRLIAVSGRVIHIRDVAGLRAYPE